MSRLQNLLFALGVTGAGRFFLIRDRLNGRLRRARSAGTEGSLVSRHRISSGGSTLDAVFVGPALRSPVAALLICHGIGEIVDHWLPVQHLLATERIASLIFDYTGCGRSRGYVTSTQCEEDAKSAWTYLETLTPGLPRSLLGFSLGSGIAGAVLHQINPVHLTLCAAFTSLRDAVRLLGIAVRLTPSIWNTVGSLQASAVPTLIMHGSEDRLFPVQMAHDLHAASSSRAQLVIVPFLTHDDPYNRPSPEYWQTVARAIRSAVGQPQA